MLRRLNDWITNNIRDTPNFIEGVRNSSRYVLISEHAPGQCPVNADIAWTFRLKLLRYSNEVGAVTMAR